MRFLLCVILFIAFNFTINDEVKAATIERYIDPVMGCSMLLSGTIVSGDATRLEAIVEELSSEPGAWRGGRRLCLNSPGGSFVEGVRLAQTIRGMPNLGTAIGDSHVCESACAIAFMAGGWTEGGYDSVRPIMHPRSRLGFHAPSIDIPSGQYNEAQVSQAWNVALGAVAQILEMRSRPLNVGDNYNFSDLLFLEMISTPPDSMYYIDTVERATRFEIAVFPVGINASSTTQAFTNLCSSAAGGWMGSHVSVPLIRRQGANEIQAYFSTGFGDEAASSCRITLRREALVDRNVFLLSRDRPILIEWNGSEGGGGPYATVSGAFTYMSFDGSMRLDALPTDMEGSWEEFSARIQMVGPRTEQCWLTSAGSRITNVNEYVNLRRQPDFAAPVIREVPLSEQVRVLRPDYVTIIGEQRTYDACLSACQAFAQNPEDRSAADQVQQCINDNLLWYEITDARGNRGWVSRRFLE